MKRQLERLKGKRLVTGDANLMTKDEICINTTPNGGVEVKEIGVDGKIKDLAGGGNNTDQIDVFDVVKNPRFFCVIKDTSGSDSGPADVLIGDGGFLVPYAVYNKKKVTGVSMVFDINNNGFKGFPCYIMFDYDSPNVFGGGGTFGAILDETIQNCPEDGYYITKEEFLKVWNESE